MTRARRLWMVFGRIAGMPPESYRRQFRSG